MKPSNREDNTYDVLVVGAGTSGMEASLSLGDMGYKVLLAEKAPSIGGKTILLSKVFPTLDCASCISTPKMAATAHHPNVRLMVYTEVEDIVPENGRFVAKLRQKATYADPAKCTGCAQCETVCTVAVPDQYNYGLIARRAAHIPFPQAIPKKAIVDKRGSAPCHAECPAGVHASGFVSLVRAGKYAEGFRLHLEDAPLVGVLSRACYAPCEGACTRGDDEGAVNIRAVKRFMVDRYYAEHPEPEYGVPAELLPTKVAVVGSGPAGLSAAYFLARAGHRVTVFEAEAQAGGMLRYGLPSYRLPKDVVDRDLKNITALGVEIKTHTRVTSLAALQTQGFAGIVVAVGGKEPRPVSIAGLDLVTASDCMSFLHECSDTACRDQRGEIADKHVVVIGGGNVAIDVARSSLRLGAKSVTVLCLECRKDMPAHSFEIQEAQEEGIVFHPASVTERIFSTPEGSMLEFLEVESFSFAGGQSQIKTVPGSAQQIRADTVVLAVGLSPSTGLFAAELKLNKNKTIQVNERTMETSLPGVFAAGDGVIGPGIIVKAVGQGKRAAHYLDMKLRGVAVTDNDAWGTLPPAADKAWVHAENTGLRAQPPLASPHKTAKERVNSFEAYEGALDEAQARSAAGRCLDCAICSQCLECEKICPALAFDFKQQDKELRVNAGAVILAGGFDILDPGAKPLLGYGRFPNVISGPQMDRLLAPTRPFNGVLRPSDGREPESIAMVLCSGSRDHAVCNPMCCRIGCMYAIKQAQLLMGALPLAEVTIYLMDVRAFGKGYDEFFEQAKGMGVNFVKGKVARIEEEANGNLKVFYEDLENGKGLVTANHDLAVLSVGLQPNRDLAARVKNLGLQQDALEYIAEADALGEPGQTHVPGVFVAGAFTAPCDIPDSVVHASAAAAQAACYLSRAQAADNREKPAGERA